MVTASPGVRTSVPNVTIDSAGRPSVSVASALAGAIKVGTSAQQQALLSQVGLFKVVNPVYIYLNNSLNYLLSILKCIFI